MYDFTASPKAAVMENPAAFKAAKQVTACAWSPPGRLVAWADIATEKRRPMYRLNVADMQSGQGFTSVFGLNASTVSHTYGQASAPAPAGD